MYVQMRNTNDVTIQMSMAVVSSVHSSASFEEAGQYGLGRLGFSDLSLKDEQHLSIRAVYEGRSGLGRARVIKSSIFNQLGDSRAALCW